MGTATGTGTASNTLTASVTASATATLTASNAALVTGRGWTRPAASNTKSVPRR